MSTKPSLMITRLLVVLCAFGRFGGALAAEDETGQIMSRPLKFEWRDGPEAYGPKGEKKDKFAHVWAWKDSTLWKRLGCAIDDTSRIPHPYHQKDQWKPIVKDMIHAATGRSISHEEIKFENPQASISGNNNDPNSNGDGFLAYHRDNAITTKFDGVEYQTYRINIYVKGREQLMIGSNTIVPCTDLLQRPLLRPDQPMVTSTRYPPLEFSGAGFGGVRIDSEFKPRQTLAVNLKETPVVMWADSDVVHRGIKSAESRTWVDIVVQIPREGCAQSEMESNDE